METKMFQSFYKENSQWTDGENDQQILPKKKPSN